MKKLLATLVTASMALSLAACGSSTTTTTTTTTTTADETEAAGDEVVMPEGDLGDTAITVVDYADISTLYPLDIGTICDQLPVSLMYDCLLKLDENQDYIWMLATGCDMSEDGLEYTFYLREGVTFSDGTEFNAEAAKMNLDIMADQSNGYASQFMYEYIDSTEIIDDYTIKVTLSQVFAPFLNALAIEPASMVAPSLLEQGDEALASSTCGTGQYTLTDRQVGDYMVLSLNEDWWGYEAGVADEGTGFSSITIIPVTEEATRVSMLMNGEADYITSLTPANMTVLESSGYTIDQKAGAQMSYFYLNCQKEIFQDVRVRQAIAMAIDVAALNTVVYGGENEVATSPLTTAIKYYEPQEAYTYDIEAAKELLAEAGYPDGFSLVCWEENDTTDIQRGEFIQQQLEQIGIDLQIYPQEGGFLSENVNAFDGDPAEAEFDCYIRGYGADTCDADEAIGRFQTDAFPPMGGNYSFWSNEEYDACIAEAASTLDDDVRAAAYAEAQEIFWEEVPAVCLLCTTYNAAHNDKIEGTTFSVAGLPYFLGASYVQ